MEALVSSTPALPPDLYMFLIADLIFLPPLLSSPSASPGTLATLSINLQLMQKPQVNRMEMGTRSKFLAFYTDLIPRWSSA